MDSTKSILTEPCLISLVKWRLRGNESALYKQIRDVRKGKKKNSKAIDYTCTQEVDINKQSWELEALVTRWTIFWTVFTSSNRGKKCHRSERHFYLVIHNTIIVEGQKIPTALFSTGLCLTHIPSSDATFLTVIPFMFSLYLHTVQKHKTICTHFPIKPHHSEVLLSSGTLAQRLKHYHFLT